MFNDTVIALYVGNMKKCARQADKDYPISNHKFIKKIGNGSSGHASEINDKKYGNFVLMMLEKKVTVAVIYHESLHAAMYMISIVGIVISVDNHEVLAYLQGYIANEIIKKLK